MHNRIHPLSILSNLKKIINNLSFICSTQVEEKESQEEESGAKCRWCGQQRGGRCKGGNQNAKHLQHIHKRYTNGYGSVQHATETGKNTRGSNAKALSVLEHSACSKNG